MHYPRSASFSRPVVALFLTAAVVSSVRGAVLDDVGVTALRALQPSLTGSGVTVAQPEAQIATDAFEVNPTAASASSIFDYYNASGTFATGFSNPVGIESSHADQVGYAFYGTVDGPAKGVAKVVNYDANYFVSGLIFRLTPMTAKVANQSFIFTNITDPSNAAAILQLYDNYVSKYSTVIVTAVGNTAGTIQLPAGAYNVISVAAINGATGGGPTSDGRTKPDIAAPGSATSYATPVVSGIATVLYQAAARGDGGAGTSLTAVDSMVIKALLLNGANKTVGWTHTTTSPLSFVTGAGQVDALKAYQNLTAGTRGPTITNTVSLNAAHDAVASGTAVGSQGWIRRSGINSDDTHDAVDHFLIDLSSGGTLFSLNATLTWNREYNDGIAKGTSTVVSKINNLDFYLYDALTNTLVASSVSPVDNVEHLASIVVPAGKYDLQVLKRGGAVGTTNVTNSTLSYFTETYGMAWNANPITTTGSTITSNNQFLEFSKSRTVSGISGVNAVQVDAGANLNLNILAAGSVQNEGTITFSNTNSQVVSTKIVGGGGLTQAGSGTTTLTGGYAGTGAINVPSGKLQISSSVAARGTADTAIKMQSLSVGGLFNVTNHDLIVGNTSKTALQNLIIAGFSSSGTNGLWSSTAGPDSAFFVPLDATLFSISSFDSLNVDQPNSFVLQYATFGDVDLNGIVNADDFSVIAGDFGQTTLGLNDIFAAWTSGDADLNGVVNADDFSVVAGNFGATVHGGAIEALNAQFGLGATGLAAAPEPTTLGLLALGVTPLLLARRRRGNA